MKLTAINTGNAVIRVHKTGCGDVNKTIKRHPGASVWSFEAANQHDALREVFADFVADWDAEGVAVEDGASDGAQFLACTKGLPTEAYVEHDERQAEFDRTFVSAEGRTNPNLHPVYGWPVAGEAPATDADAAAQLIAKTTELIDELETKHATVVHLAYRVGLVGANGQALSFAKQSGTAFRRFDDVTAAYDFALTRKTGYVSTGDGTWLRRGGRYVIVTVTNAITNELVTVGRYKVEPPHSNNTPEHDDDHPNAHLIIPKLVVDALQAAATAA